MRYFRIETDLIPGNRGKCSIIQSDGKQHWTLATFKGPDGFEAAMLIAKLLAEHALKDDPTPDKWNLPSPSSDKLEGGK